MHGQMPKPLAVFAWGVLATVAIAAAHLLIEWGGAPPDQGLAPAGEVPRVSETVPSSPHRPEPRRAPLDVGEQDAAPENRLRPKWNPSPGAMQNLDKIALFWGRVSDVRQWSQELARAEGPERKVLAKKILSNSRAAWLPKIGPEEPGSGFFRYYRARLLMIAGQKDEAMKLFAELVGFRPMMDEAWPPVAAEVLYSKDGVSQQARLKLQLLRAKLWPLRSSARLYAGLDRENT